jgi:hypothetical protein
MQIPEEFSETVIDCRGQSEVESLIFARAVLEGGQG